jgi:hypothetical protein
MQRRRRAYPWPASDVPSSIGPSRFVRCGEPFAASTVESVCRPPPGARQRATSTPDNQGPSMLKTITYAMIGVLACGLVVAVVGASGTLLPG